MFVTNTCLIMPEEKFAYSKVRLKIINIFDNIM